MTRASRALWGLCALTTLRAFVAQSVMRSRVIGLTLCCLIVALSSGSRVAAQSAESKVLALPISAGAIAALVEFPTSQAAEARLAEALASLAANCAPRPRELCSSRRIDRSFRRLVPHSTAKRTSMRSAKRPARSPGSAVVRTTRAFSRPGSAYRLIGSCWSTLAAG